MKPPTRQDLEKAEAFLVKRKDIPANVVGQAVTLHWSELVRFLALYGNAKAAAVREHRKVR